MSIYEIEIKSLLGSEKNAQSLKKKIKSKGGTLSGGSKQRNHYFVLHNQNDLRKKLVSQIPKEKEILFSRILDEGKNLSVRTRDADGKVILVIKASIGDDSSANGISRMEFESVMPVTLDELDKLLLDTGLEYQAKWSREREEYKLNDVNVCIDKNAGYGYLAEFEKICSDSKEQEKIKEELYALMKRFEVQELMQDRLERMFDYYNKNWRDYYGTNKVFNIE